MDQPIASDETVESRLRAPTPTKIVFLTLLWLTVACALPLYQLREDRRQARENMQHLLAADKPDHAEVIAAFDRSNQYLDAAASGPCLILAFTSIFLVNQLLKLRSRYNALADESSTPNRGAPVQ